MPLSKANQRRVILAVTVGGMLEWYEFFLYIYWSPLLAKIFFQSSSELVGLMNTLFIFFIGFLARPLGGLFFGYLGDRFGRKLAFMVTIVTMTIPNVSIAFIPTYAAIGIAAPILLGLMRCLQGIPVGGEVPGAMCYLYESALPTNRRFHTSFTFFGPQLGIIISILECFYLEKHLSPEQLAAWGWRLSFAFSGVIGLVGIILRHKIKETPPFKILEAEKKTFHHPLVEAVRWHKKNILLGFAASMAEASGFFMFSAFSGLYFVSIGVLNSAENVAITVTILAIFSGAILLFGRLGDHTRIKRLLIGSSLAIVLFSSTLFFLDIPPTKLSIFLFGALFMILLSAQTALLPSLLCDLYPNRVRFSCIGLSSNLSDSLIGGFIPVATLYLMRSSEHINAFMIVLTIAFLFSLIPFSLIKYKPLSPSQTWP